MRRSAMKRAMSILLACILMLAWCTLGEETEPLQLRICVYDRCGGCGADGPGCGNCDEIGRLHGIVKETLGDRLYDGSMLYTMPNCRVLVVLEEYKQYCKDFGVYDELYGYYPAAFILRPDGSGVFAVGEEMMTSLGEIIDAFERGDSTEEIQKWVDDRRAEVYNDTEMDGTA